MNIKSKKGFTLVEVVVAVAILAIIMVPISLVFTTAYTSFIGESDKVTAQQSARELLYGKGIDSYGIMGDLERSNATGENILIGTQTDDVNAIGSSISIQDDKNIIKKYTFNSDDEELRYETIADGSTVSDIDYFENDKSSNGNPVKVKKFVVEKVKKGSISDTDTDDVTDTDMIKTTVTVVCGKSGEITLQSSYRLPDIER